jgi:hypothetical protein
MPLSHQMGSRSTKSHQNTSSDSPQHTQIRRESIRLTEKNLCEANLTNLAEMRELNNVKMTI